MKIHKGIAVVAALGCGALAPLATTAAASAANPTAGTAGTVGAPHNGPLAFSGTSVAANNTTPSGTGWSEANPDGTDGGGRHEIVPSGGGVDPTSSDSDVVFSHDGGKVAFIQRSDSTLWTANADGSDARRLAVPAVGYGLEKPCWSGDGATVYFTQIVNSANGSYTPSILQVPATGGPATPLLAQPDANGDLDVVVSPDGTKIAYGTVAPGFAGPKVVVADAKTHAKLSEIPKSTAPQFSPDGKVLAVAGVSGESGSTIVFYPPDGLAGPGSRGQTVVSDLASYQSFAFSPDSSEIAYASTSGEIQISQLWNGVAVKTGIAEDHVGEAISWQNGPSYTGPVSALVQNVTASVRYGGADRIATSVVTADAAYGDPASGLHANIAVISRSDTFADALAGNALAAQKGGPLMLTGSAKLDQRVAAELTKTLAPHSTVYLLGGPQALSPRVEADIAALGFTPKRLAGTDRFSTAVRIAEEISAHPKAILVATGTNFPDALAAGAATTGNVGTVADWSGVVVLTDGATMPAATKDYLSGFSPATARIFGVGGAGLTAARTLPYANQIVPLSGKDRYETAADVATSQDLFADSRGIGSVRPVQFAGLATGDNWPDALSGGALVGALHGALLLADGPSVPKEELVLPSTLLTLGVFGGTSVVPDSAVAEVVNDTWGGGAAAVVR